MPPDHRVVDGGHAAIFAKTVRAVFDDPFAHFDELDWIQPGRASQKPIASKIKG